MNKSRSRELIISLLLLALTAIVRLVGIGIYPGGVNVDEAYSGYEAWSMLNYGTDSWGYHNPVYLTVWGSGQSVLNSILMMPFIAVGGLNTVTIRLPQALIGILAVWVFYRLLQKIANPTVALTGMALMAICPWHIMMSRWGLDCNLAPEFMLFAFYFLILGVERLSYLPISALLWGLSLYCYAAIWVVVVILLGIWCIYLLAFHKISISRWSVMSIIILGGVALPLILFVAVNMGLLPEIRTPFLSIPKLVDFRSDEIGMSNVIGNIKALVRLIITQNDGLIWNTTSYFGMYYLISMPVIVIGLILMMQAAYAGIRQKRFTYDFMVFIWLFVAVGCGIIQGVNANKINAIHIPILILWTKGLCWLYRRCKKYGKVGIVLLYSICFICFEGYYFTGYQTLISARQNAGVSDAIETAMNIRETFGFETISVPNAVRHSEVLFYTQWPTDDYRATVQWQSYPARWLKAASFGCFEWQRENEKIQNPDKDTIYIFTLEDAKVFAEGWVTEYFGEFGVAYYVE